MILRDLIDLSETIQPGVGDRSDPDFYDIEIQKDTLMEGMRARIITGTIRDHTYARPYKMVMQFCGVDNKVTEEDKVVVRCSCKSYRFFFCDANKIWRCHFGKMPTPYIPVPEAELKRVRPLPKNPDHVPGLCKHLIAFGRLISNLYSDEQD